MSHTMKLWERAIKRNDNRDQKSVWYHAWEVDRESYFLGTTTYEEIQVAKEGPIWCSLTWRRSTIRYREMSCGGPWRNTKSQQSRLSLVKDMYDKVVEVFK